MFKVAYYEIKKLMRDKRWLIIFILNPVALVLLFGFVAYREPEDISVAIYNKSANRYSEDIIQHILETKSLDVSFSGSEQSVRDSLAKDQKRLGIIVGIEKKDDKITGAIEIINNLMSPDINKKAAADIQKAVQYELREFTAENLRYEINLAQQNALDGEEYRQSAALTELKNSIGSLTVPTDSKKQIEAKISNLSSHGKLALDENTLTNHSIDVEEKDNSQNKVDYFDFYASAGIIAIIIFIGLNASATSITHERAEGTFERFFVAPFTKSQLMMGKLLAFSITSLALSIISLSSLKLIFNVNFGDIWLVLSVAFITGLLASSLGLLISAVTFSVAESITLSVFAFFSSLLLMTFIFPMEVMHPMIGKLSAILPFAYAVKAMRQINMLDAGWTDIWPSLATLAGYLIIFQVASILILRRKIH